MSDFIGYVRTKDGGAVQVKSLNELADAVEESLTDEERAARRLAASEALEEYRRKSPLAALMQRGAG